jgi:hypothetical protein
MWLNKSFHWLVIFCLIIGLSGCNRLTSQTPVNSSLSDSHPVTLADILKGEHLLAYLNKDQLYLVDPVYPHPYYIYTLKTEEIPPVTTLATFIVSPSKTYIVWYSPLKGVIKLNLSTMQTDTVWPASDWLNQNPYLTFGPAQDLLYFIDNKGTHLISVNLATKENNDTQIPYPFGNLFSISPDNKHIVFISGFGQTKTYPQYMFTDIKGQQPHRFTTTTDINFRQLLIWLPDSSGILLTHDKNQLQYYSMAKPEKPEEYHRLEPGDTITNLSSLDGTMFIQVNNNRWQVYDLASKKIVASIPDVIAAELNRPVFKPWYQQHFLIEETIKPGQEQFNRLWVSTFQGTKKVIIEKYNQTTLENKTPSI